MVSLRVCGVVIGGGRRSGCVCGFGAVVGIEERSVVSRSVRWWPAGVGCWSFAQAGVISYARGLPCHKASFAAVLLAKRPYWLGGWFGAVWCRCSVLLVY